MGAATSTADAAAADHPPVVPPRRSRSMASLVQAGQDAKLHRERLKKVWDEHFQRQQTQARKWQDRRTELRANGLSSIVPVEAAEAALAMKALQLEQAMDARAMVVLGNQLKRIGTSLRSGEWAKAPSPTEALTKDRKMGKLRRRLREVVEQRRLARQRVDAMAQFTRPRSAKTRRTVVLHAINAVVEAAGHGHGQGHGDGDGDDEEKNVARRKTPSEQRDRRTLSTDSVAAAAAAASAGVFVADGTSPPKPPQRHGLRKRQRQRPWWERVLSEHHKARVRDAQASFDAIIVDMRSAEGVELAEWRHGLVTAAESSRIPPAKYVCAFINTFSERLAQRFIVSDYDGCCALRVLVESLVFPLIIGAYESDLDGKTSLAPTSGNSGGVGQDDEHVAYERVSAAQRDAAWQQRLHDVQGDLGVGLHDTPDQDPNDREQEQEQGQGQGQHRESERESPSPSPSPSHSRAVAFRRELLETEGRGLGPEGRSLLQAAFGPPRSPGPAVAVAVDVAVDSHASMRWPSEEEHKRRRRHSHRPRHRPRHRSSSPAAELKSGAAKTKTGTAEKAEQQKDEEAPFEVTVGHLRTWGSANVPSAAMAALLRAVEALHAEAARRLDRDRASLGLDDIFPVLLVLVVRSQVHAIHRRIELCERFWACATIGDIMRWRDGAPQQAAAEAQFWLCQVQASVEYICKPGPTAFTIPTPVAADVVEEAIEEGEGGVTVAISKAGGTKSIMDSRRPASSSASICRDDHQHHHGARATVMMVAGQNVAAGSKAFDRASDV